MTRRELVLSFIIICLLMWLSWLSAWPSCESLSHGYTWRLNPKTRACEIALNNQGYITWWPPETVFR